MNSGALFATLLFCIQSASFCAGKEILPADCNCRDWYGACRRLGETWTDEDLWMYRCSAADGSDATFIGCQVTSKLSGQSRQMAVGRNESVDGFWINCEANEIRQKLEQEPRCMTEEGPRHVGEEFRQGIFHWLCLETGRWVKGCYFQNETGQWTLLGLGETGYDGLIKHTCDRYKDNPGVVQYHASIREDVAHKSPGNKGQNKLLPEFVDKRLKNTPSEWTHTNAVIFIAEEAPNTRVRYLPPSRSIHAPPPQFGRSK